jgi:hypothetical protein
MIGEGVIAESYVSFDVTWKNPGSGKQSEWDQSKQSIELHSIDLYPDLNYTKASALATYYKYTSLDKILGIIDKINAVIDEKIQEKSQANEALGLPLSTSYSPGLPAVANKPTELSTISKDLQKTAKTAQVDQAITQNDIEPKKKETIDKNQEVNPEETGSTGISYTVNVTGDRLKLIDIQGKGSGVSEVLITHKISDNIVKQVDGEKLENSNKINATVNVGGLLGKSFTMTFEEFNSEDGLNLLVEILPSVELRFTPGETSVIPKSEGSRANDDWLVDFAEMIKDKRMGKTIISTNSAEKVKASANK